MLEKRLAFAVNGPRMKRKLQRLGEIIALHPDKIVRENLRKVIDQVHNRHVAR